MNLGLVIFFGLLGSSLVSAEDVSKKASKKSSVEAVSTTTAANDKVSSEANPFPELEETFAKFKNSDSFKMQVKRTQMLIVGEDRTYLGNIEVSGQRFRWENHRPIESLVVFDGEILWSAEPPPPGIEAPLQVTKQKVDKASKEQPLFALLRRPEALGSQFEIKVLGQAQGDGGEVIYGLTPKADNGAVEDLRVAIEPGKKQLKQVVYQDEIGNRTILALSGFEFDVALPKERFNYVPPAGADVTEI